MINRILNITKNSLLKRALNVYQKQHEAISQNIANSNNSAYKRVNTDFTHELELAKSSRLKANDNRHFTNGLQVESSNPNIKSEDENVNLTEEMAFLAENQIKYEFTTRMLNRFYKGISTSISGRIS